MSVNPSIASGSQATPSPVISPQQLAVVGYTDSWREGVPGVPYYLSLGNSVTVTYTDQTVIGSNVELYGGEGTFLLVTTGDFTYQLTGTVNSNVRGSTVQWYKVTDPNDIQPIGQEVPVGETATALYTPASNESVELKIKAPAGTNFEYPARVTSVNATVQTVTGFIS